MAILKHDLFKFYEVWNAKNVGVLKSSDIQDRTPYNGLAFQTSRLAIPSLFAIL